MTGITGCLGALLISAVSAFAVPQQINYQGQLSSPSGTQLDKTLAMAFYLNTDGTKPPEGWTD